MKSVSFYGKIVYDMIIKNTPSLTDGFPSRENRTENRFPVSAFLVERDFRLTAVYAVRAKQDKRRVGDDAVTDAEAR